MGRGGTQTRNLYTFGKEPIETSCIWIYGYLITAICGVKRGGGHKHTIAPPPIKSWGGSCPFPPPPASYASDTHTHTYIYTGVGRGGGGGKGECAPHFFDWGAIVCLCPPSLLTPHFHFPLELYVYITDK